MDDYGDSVGAAYDSGSWVRLSSPKLPTSSKTNKELEVRL